MTSIMLKRYWFIIYPQDLFCAGNIGVSAYSKTGAISLITESASVNSFLGRHVLKINDETETIEDIDIRLLDPNHVIPNMGVVTWEGVWWPNLNR